MFMFYLILICANYNSIETQVSEPCEAHSVPNGGTVYYFCDSNNDVQCNVLNAVGSRQFTSYTCVNGSWIALNQSRSNESCVTLESKIATIYYSCDSSNDLQANFSYRPDSITTGHITLSTCVNGTWTESDQPTSNVPTTHSPEPTTEPSVQTTQPLVHTTQSSEPTTSNTKQTTTPTMQTTQPTEPTNSPAIQTTQPTEPTNSPAIQTTQPPVQSTQHTVQTTQSSMQTTESSARTAQPSMLTTHPQVQTTQSTVQMSQSFEHTTWLTLQTSQSSVQTTKPTLKMTQPSVKINLPSVQTTLSHVTAPPATNKTTSVAMGQSHQESSVTIGELMKSPMAESRKGTSDTYGGITAVASFSAILGSLVIGSTAYLILRRLDCCKVSPATTEGNVP